MIFRITYILLLSICLFSNPANAQTWKWAKGSTSHKSTIESWPIAVDSLGNVYEAGTIGSSAIADTATRSYFGSDTIRGWKNVLVSTDSNGNYRWALPIQYGAYGMVTKISVGPTGDIYLFGTFSGKYKIGTDSLTTPALLYAFYVARLTSSGSVKWLKKVAQSNLYYEGPTGDIDGYGNLYIAGCYKGSSITIGSTTLYNSGVSTLPDVFVTKLDTAGDPVWAKSFGGDSAEYVSSVTTTISGEVLVAGFYKSLHFSIGSTTFTNPSTNHYFYLVKFDNFGNFVWGNTITNHGSSSTIYNTTFDMWGNAYVTGRYSGYISFGSTSLPSTIFFNTYLAQYSPAGSYMWSRVFTNHTGGFSVVTDRCANVWLGGATGVSFDDAFIAQYDIFGTLNDSFHLAVGGDDLMGLAVDNKGNLFLGADYYYNTVLGHDTLTLTDSTKEGLFVAKYSYPFCDPNSHPLHTLTSTPENTAITLYPNPATTECTIAIAGTTAMLQRIDIYDITGRLSNSYALKEATATIDIGSLNRGIYLCKVYTTDNSVFIKKLIAEQ